MPNYRRPHIAGGTYFITQVTYQRERWFCGEVGRQALREAIITVRQNHPFTIDAFVLLPDHFHVSITTRTFIRIRIADGQPEFQP